MQTHGRSSRCICFLCAGMLVCSGGSACDYSQVSLTQVSDLWMLTKIPLRYLDVPRLVSWLSARQYAPEGGFSGRTNKLVDGCYSHWIGGCWPLLQACLDGPSSTGSASKSQLTPVSTVGSLYSREGLIRYILCCCQDWTTRGGLRDKPSRSVEAYQAYGFRKLTSSVLVTPMHTIRAMSWQG